MNNEPVAWMQIHYKDKMCVTKLSPVKTWEDDVPLYTHPAKTLTDEEIISIYQSLWKFLPSEEPDLAKDIKKFAKAILRKAQEK
jgi:hypothetical protein